jgi:hypothetical protein
MVQPNDGSGRVFGARQRLGKAGASLKNWVQKQLQQSPLQSGATPAFTSEAIANAMSQAAPDRCHGAVSNLPPDLLLYKVRVGQVYFLPDFEYFTSFSTLFNNNLGRTRFHQVTCYCPV